jgi:hypothetical protein
VCRFRGRLEDAFALTGATLESLDAISGDPVNPDSFRALVHLIEIARDELSNSQSSRMPTNLVKFDFDRQQSYLAKILALLAYVEKSEPLDLPESSPMMAMTGAGARGV